MARFIKEESIQRKPQWIVGWRRVNREPVNTDEHSRSAGRSRFEWIAQRMDRTRVEGHTEIPSTKRQANQVGQYV
jgi:hypothetical protein